MPTPAPFKLIDPSLVLTFESADVELKCSARQVTHTIDYDTTDDSTFCEPSAEGIGKITQAIELTVLQSFGTDGLWNSLHPLELKVVDFRLETVAGEIAVGTPVMIGTCLVPPVPLVDAGISENTELSLSFKIRTAAIHTVEPTP